MSRNVYDGGAWDVGPPGAEEDYAAYSSHRERRNRDGRYDYGGHEPGRYDRRQRRSHSPSPERDRKRCPPRRRHSPSGTPSPSRLRCFSISSDSDRSTTSRPRRPASPPPRSDGRSRRSGSSPEQVRRHRAPSFTPPKSYKTRAASKSSSSRSTSSSFSRSRSRSRSYSSRSRSHSPRNSKKRRNTRRSTSQRRTSKSRRSGSRRRALSSRHSASPRRSSSSKRSASSQHSASPRRSASPAHSPSRSSHSDSSSSSRGRFSGYDRKRYFRALKEKVAKERELKEQKGEEVEVKEEVPPSPEITTDDIYALEYKQLPPLDGINFEDLPPPPELAGGSGLSRRSAPPVSIRNDGSFLEMFKKLQEETQKAEASTAPTPIVRKPVPPFIGKRRGGRVLKTGVVQKVKVKEETSDAAPKDAWSLYMQEVKKYRETSCEEERKTRPLVK